MTIDPKQYRPSFLRKGLEATPKPTASRTCRMCPSKLSPWLRYYCSGVCVNAAKMAGTYGKEEQG